MASLLMVKTKRKQSSPEAHPEHLDYQGHHGWKPVSSKMQLLSDHRRGSIAEADIPNNNYFSTKNQNENDIPKALGILRQQRRESMAHADYHQATGESDMMIPKTLEILKKMRSNSSPGMCSSAPSTYTLSDHEPANPRRRGQSMANLSMDRLDFHSESHRSEMKPLPKSLEKLKIKRRGSIPALMFGSAPLIEEVQSGMSSLAGAKDTRKPSTTRRGSITDALLSHAGHLEVGGRSEMKPLPNALGKLQVHRRGSISEALMSHAGHLDVGVSGDMRPLPKALQLLKKQRSGSIADALQAYSKNHDVLASGLNDMKPLSKELETIKAQRRQSSPGGLLKHTYYYSDQDQDELKPLPKMVAMPRQPRRQSSPVTSEHANYYGMAELDQPMRYSSKLMNSIWGHYNENSVHNFKSLQCGGVSTSCPVAAEHRHQQSHKLAGSPASTCRGSLQQRLGELGEAVAVNFMDNLNQYY